MHVTATNAMGNLTFIDADGVCAVHTACYSSARRARFTLDWTRANATADQQLSQSQRCWPNCAASVSGSATLRHGTGSAAPCKKTSHALR